MNGAVSGPHRRALVARPINATSRETSFDLHQAGSLLRVELALFGSREGLGILLSDCLLDQIGPKTAAREVLKVEVFGRSATRKAHLVGAAARDDLCLISRIWAVIFMSRQRAEGKVRASRPALTPTRANMAEAEK